MNMDPIFNAPVTFVIDRFSSKQLLEMGEQLQSLTLLPAITLVKQVPFFPAQFYGIADSVYLEKQVIQEAKRTLLEALDLLGVRATYEIVRGSNPSRLASRGGIVIQTMAEFNAWLPLEVPEKSRPVVGVVNG